MYDLYHFSDRILTHFSNYLFIYLLYRTLELKANVVIKKIKYCFTCYRRKNQVY